MERHLALAFERFDQAELRFCRYVNRSARSAAVRSLFKTVSWLGDGWCWYALLGLLPLQSGAAGGLAALTLLIASSRVILGLHYPTDVVAGALLGGSLGIGSVLIGQLAPV
jgi:hypothetical protein